MTLPGGVTLVGTVAGVRGDVVQTVTFSRLGPAQRLHAWLRLLALTSSSPERPFEACTIGRSTGGRSRTSTARIAALGPDPAARRTTALQQLQVLVDLFLRGMREPLPLYARTSAAWAEAVAAGRRTDSAARSWTSEYRFDREDKDPEHALVLGSPLTFDEMLSRGGSPQGDEAAWEPSEDTRFGVYARRLWDGLLAREQVVDR